MARSYIRGNAIEKKVDGSWVYSDTKEKIVIKDRPCGRCHEYQTKEGHDHCLGTLKGLMNACCGHGSDGEAYVQYWDGSRIGGNDAIAMRPPRARHARQ